MITPCLNDYHLQFLRLLTDRSARFIIIGGQARYVHHRTRTRDLDIWIDISAQNRPAIDRCLYSWALEHPQHSKLDFNPPLTLRPGVQVKFPDTRDAVYYLDRSGEPTEISHEDCIDVLTSVREADFDEFYRRAYWQMIEGMNLPFLAAGDLQAISPAKS
jgi:hypothetical protein